MTQTITVPWLELMPHMKQEGEYPDPVTFTGKLEVTSTKFAPARSTLDFLFFTITLLTDVDVTAGSSMVIHASVGPVAQVVTEHEVTMLNMDSYPMVGFRIAVKLTVDSPFMIDSLSSPDPLIDGITVAIGDGERQAPGCSPTPAVPGTCEQTFFSN